MLKEFREHRVYKVLKEDKVLKEFKVRKEILVEVVV